MSSRRRTGTAWTLATPAWAVRDGRVSEIPLDAGIVLGVAPDEVYEVQHFQMQPGVRLALVTDGMSERDAADAEIETLLGTLGDLHPRDTVQVLTGAVLRVTGGAVRDDATVLVIDWYGAARAGSAHGPTVSPTPADAVIPGQV